MNITTFRAFSDELRKEAMGVETYQALKALPGLRKGRLALQYLKSQPPPVSRTLGRLKSPPIPPR